MEEDVDVEEDDELRRQEGSADAPPDHQPEVCAGEGGRCDQEGPSFEPEEELPHEPEAVRRRMPACERPPIPPDREEECNNMAASILEDIKNRNGWSTYQTYIRMYSAWFAARYDAQPPICELTGLIILSLQLATDFMRWMGSPGAAKTVNQV